MKWNCCVLISGPKRCKRGRCGRGECVLTSIPPYYECKCKEPFQPPRCVHSKDYFFVQTTLFSCWKQVFTVDCFSPKCHCVSLIHVGMVDNASTMVMTSSASALWGSQDVSAMLVNTLLLSFSQSSLHINLTHILTVWGIFLRPRWLLWWWRRVIPWQSEWDWWRPRMPLLELSLHPGQRCWSLQLLRGQQWTWPSQLLQVGVFK